jgi:hypothetical protein
MNHNFGTISGKKFTYPFSIMNPREEEYGVYMFGTSSGMQDRHFWFEGRHKFLISAGSLRFIKTDKALLAIDLGGVAGGGQINYSNRHRPGCFSSLALSDLLIEATTRVVSVLPLTAKYYQVDLTNLNMHEQLEVTFLLDDK